MQGTPAPAQKSPAAPSIIPACAGNAQAQMAAIQRSPHHPRVCRERYGKRCCICQVAGSSPRVQGTHGTERQCCVQKRIIPACAGNAFHSMPKLKEDSDHPRVCRERDRTQIPQVFAKGSSPRVQGTPCCSIHSSSSIPDHPRVCRERNHSTSTPMVLCGSSRRVQGTPPLHLKSRTGFRIIPACAGNAKARATLYQGLPDHPRVCRERGAGDAIEKIGGGSSPRVQGTRFNPDRFLVHRRIIPACAGNATRRRQCAIRGSDHPRVCRERLAVAAFPDIGCGSSPRVQGTRFGQSRETNRRRIIPACAGNALGSSA